MISAHELGRWRTCRPQDEEESGLTSPCFAVGKSLCKNASVCPTEVCVATLSICRGPIDRCSAAMRHATAIHPSGPRQSRSDGLCRPQLQRGFFMEKLASMAEGRESASAALPV